ncbi:hypothetical protein BH20ACT2_BH20ACT2_09140 [soil metagenome]
MALVAGPMVLVAYLLAATFWSWLHRIAAVPPGTDTDEDEDAFAPSADITRPAELAEVLLVLVLTTGAEQLVRAVAPGFTFSRVASLSNQVIPVWDSAALWTGLAALAGLVAPLWSRFRGGWGIAPGLALAVRYVPVVFAAAWVGFAVGLLFFRRARPAFPVALAAAVSFAWVAWVADWRPAWGVTNGPEVSLWVMICTAVLFARWYRGDVLAR